MKYVSGRLRKLELGLSSYSETKQSLNVIGNADITGIASASAFADFDYLQAPYGSTVSFTVTVASKSNHRYSGGSSNAYYINGIESPVLTLTPGRTYRFNNNNTGSHPFRFYYDANRTIQYTTGVNFQNTYTEITVSDTTPNVLHYQCANHALMGNSVVTNSNVVDSPYAATLRDSLTVSGNITANGNILGDNATNISGINSVTATSFFGDGSGLVNLGIPGISTSGTTEFTHLEISGNLKVAGVSTFGNDKVIVGGATTDLLVNGSARVTGELKVGDGTITLNSAGLSTFPTGVDVSGGSGLIASSAKISDLTSGRIVFAGAGGELEDSANLTFDGTTLSGSFSGDGSGLSGVSIPGINTSGTTEFTHLEISGNLKVAGVSTFNNVKLDDNNKIQIGSSQDLELYHSGSHSYIDETGTGNLYIRNGSKNSIWCQTDGQVKLYYNDSAKIATRVDGVEVTGTTETQKLHVTGISTFSDDIFIPDDKKIKFGNTSASPDFEIYHDPTLFGGVYNVIESTNGNVFFVNKDTTNKYMFIRSNDIQLRDWSNNKAYIHCRTDAQVELYYNNAKRLETSSVGVSIPQDLDVTGHTETNTINVSGASTFATAKVTDLTDNRIVIAGTGGELEDTSKLTFDGTTLAIVGDATFTGNVSVAGTLTSEDKTNIDSLGIVTARTGVRIASGGLVVSSGVATFTDAIDSNGGTNIAGGLVADTAKVSDLTNGRVVYAGASGELQDSSHLTFNGTTLNGTFSGDGTALLVTIPGISTTTTSEFTNLSVVGVLTAGSAILGSARVTDLTQGRVVFVGASGELQDNSSLTFNGSTVTAPAFAGDGSALTGITAGGVGAIGGLTVKDEGVVVGTAGSIATLDFLGGTVSVTATSGASGIATVTISTEQNQNIQTLNVSGVSTFGGNINANGNLNVSGVSTFAGDINFPDMGKAVFGTGGDLEIYHSGNGSFIKDGGIGPLTLLTNQLLIRNAANNEELIDAGENSSVNLYFDGTKRLSTTGIGASVLGQLEVNNGLDVTSGDLNVAGNAGIGSLNVTGISTFSDDIFIPDNKKIKFGNTSASPDLEIFHNTSGYNDLQSNNGNIRIRNYDTSGTGKHIYLQSENVQIRSHTNNHSMISAFAGAQVELYHNNSKRLETTSAGVSIPQDLDVTGHTETDTINVSGVSTFVGEATFKAQDVILQNNGAVLRFKNSSNTQMGAISPTVSNFDIFTHMGGSGGFRVYTGGAYKLTLDSSGNLTVSGDINANGNIVGDSSTNISGINSVTATSLFGDGSNLTGITAGATLSAASGSQRLVLTSLTSGTMTSAATDADLSFNATENLLTAGRLSITGITTFNDDVTFKGATSGRNITFDQTNNRMIFDDFAGLFFGTNTDMKIEHSGGGATIHNYTGDFYFYGPATKKFHFTRKVFVGEDLEVDGVAELDDVNVSGMSTFSSGLFLPDSTTLRIGGSAAGGDLQLYHNGSNTYIDNSTGTLHIRHSSGTGQIQILDSSQGITIQGKTGEDSIKAVPDAQVELYYDDALKLATNNGGITVTGGGNFSGVVTATSFVGDGSNLTNLPSGGGGGDKFNTTITNSVQATVYGYETDIISFSSDNTKRYVIESISVGNVTAGVGSTVNVIASINPGVTTYSSEYKVYLAYNVPVPDNGLVELLKEPMVVNPSDVIKVWATDETNTGINGAIELYASYTEHESTDYIAGYGSTTNITTTGIATVYTSTSYPTVVQSIKVTNRTDTGDFPITIQIVNGSTVTHLAKNLVVPRYASVELLDRPKRIETGAEIRMQQAAAANTIDVIVSGKKITS